MTSSNPQTSDRARAVGVKRSRRQARLRRAFEPEQVIASRYRILRFLGGGGMGEVYEVWDALLHEAVALKTLRSSRTGCIDPKAARYLRREASVARKVTHRNVCRILEFGFHEDPKQPQTSLPFIVMELLRGEPLSQYLQRKGTLTSGTVHQVALQATLGLAAIHTASVLHRDIKPENIFVQQVTPTQREIKITDFGLSRLTGPEAGKITAGCLGTVAYMAPEVLRGQAATPASDVWSLGVTLYELLTGCLPERDSEGGPRFDRAVPLPWVAVLKMCLSPKAENRFADASQLLVALYAMNLKRAGVGRLDGKTGKIKSRPPSGRATFWLATTIGVTLGALAAWLLLKAA